jgi:hypothetical protein
LIFEQSSDFKEQSHRLDDITLERDDESPGLWRKTLAVAPTLCDGTGMENDRLFRFAVIAAGVVSAGAVAALVFLFY